jgi:amino acid adenylation domain-containing protein
VFAIHHLLTQAADSAAEREAIRCEDRSLSYGELEAASNGIARTLIDGGVHRGDRVGLYLPKDERAIAALYGIMKAGAVYVPIDPKAPLARASMIAADCTASALVTTPDRAPDLLGALGDHRPDCVLLVGGEPGAKHLSVPSFAYEEATRDQDASDPHVPVIDSDLAYILYTSGSTGVPKGVMLTHRHALTFVEWCASSIGAGPDDRFSSHAPLHFDLSVFDLYVAAHGRASVALVPEAGAFFGIVLARFIRDESITVWYSVPSALMLLARAVPEPDSLRSLRAVVFAGEVYPTKHLRELRALVPHAALWNLYGPTETNVCTYYRVDDLPDDDRTIPIGHACENTEVFALRDDGGPAEVGEEGELYVRGSAVMRGYWGRPERSAEVLVPDPLAQQPRGLVYRTGDLVRLRPDGDYDFIGRRDHQIKSRGYRIELGEVEVVLSTHPQLLEAVAVPVPHETWGTSIVAYAVPSDGAAVTEAELVRFVAGRLPRYMIPSHVRLVAELPRTSTGKVDRQRLLADVG